MKVLSGQFPSIEQAANDFLEKVYIFVKIHFLFFMCNIKLILQLNICYFL